MPRAESQSNTRWAAPRGHNTSRFNDTVNRIGLGLLGQVSSVFTRLLRIGIHTAVFKPLALVIAISLVARHGQHARQPMQQRASSQPRSGHVWLLAALVGSLVGGVFLMLPGFFIPGLVAFLLAHPVCIAWLQHDAPLFASPRAWLAVGAAALWCVRCCGPAACGPVGDATLAINRFVRRCHARRSGCSAAAALCRV